MHLRPHKRFNFVGLWKYGFILSGILIALAVIGFIVSTVTVGTPLTLGTEFSGGTSITVADTGDITEDQMKEAFSKADSELGTDTQISSIQTSVDSNGTNGFVIRTSSTDSAAASSIMGNVEGQLNISSENVQIETIGASWGSSVIWSSILAFIVSCVAILIVIAIRYREPRMGVVALITLFHDMIIVLGIYAWAGMFMHLEITSDVIAALLAIIGYSLYDTIVVFHRINRNASPQMKCSMKTCANRSVNEIIVRSLNTSITSIIPILFMLILGTDTLRDFAFAMVCGMVVGVYSTLAISAPVYTVWKCREPEYARLERKYPYKVEQSPFTKEMMKQARIDSKQARLEAAEAERKAAAEKAAQEKAAAEAKAAEEKAAAEAKAAEEKAAAEAKAAEEQAAAEAQAAEEQAAVEAEEAAEQVAEAAETAEEVAAEVVETEEVAAEVVEQAEADVAESEDLQK